MYKKSILILLALLIYCSGNIHAQDTFPSAHGGGNLIPLPGTLETPEPSLVYAPIHAPVGNSASPSRHSEVSRNTMENPNNTTHSEKDSTVNVAPDKTALKAPLLPPQGKNATTQSDYLSTENMFIIFIAVTCGFFLLFLWMRTLHPKTPRILPVDVLQILGYAHMATRYPIYLIKCGNKLILVCISPAGVNSLGEITDHSEVLHILRRCGVSTDTLDIPDDSARVEPAAHQTSEEQNITEVTPSHHSSNSAESHGEGFNLGTSRADYATLLHTPAIRTPHNSESVLNSVQAEGDTLTGFSSAETFPEHLRRFQAREYDEVYQRCLNAGQER